MFPGRKANSQCSQGSREEARTLMTDGGSNSQSSSGQSGRRSDTAVSSVSTPLCTSRVESSPVRHTTYDRRRVFTKDPLYLGYLFSPSLIARTTTLHLVCSFDQDLQQSLSDTPLALPDIHTTSLSTTSSLRRLVGRLSKLPLRSPFAPQRQAYPDFRCARLSQCANLNPLLAPHCPRCKGNHLS